MRLHIDTDGVSDAAVIIAAGDIDFSNAGDLETALLLTLVAGIRDITFDLNGVTLIDSVGLGVLADGHDRVTSRGGSCRVLCDRPNILHPLTLTGLATATTRATTPQPPSSSHPLAASRRR
jgi:anti-sigma B factor antagonist